MSRIRKRKVMEKMLNFSKHLISSHVRSECLKHGLQSCCHHIKPWYLYVKSCASIRLASRCTCQMICPYGALLFPSPVSRFTRLYDLRDASLSVDNTACRNIHGLLCIVWKVFKTVTISNPKCCYYGCSKGLSVWFDIIAKCFKVARG